MDMIKRSPYHHKFVELGATFVDRLGFAAPMVFTSVEQEHRAAREAVGVFDVYYQVAVEVAVPPIAAPILVGATEIGKVTSADRGYTVGKALALGYVATPYAKEGQEVRLTSPEGERAGKIHLRALYDPDGLRVRM